MKPSPETIEAWAAGSLPEGKAEEVEAYFIDHPEELSDPFEDVGILREAAEPESAIEDPGLASLIDTLKSKPLTSFIEERWMDLLTPDSRPGLLGTLLHFEVTGTIASTGMAIVLEASDPELERTVALKILSPALALDPTAHTRFLREARMMASLEHENILPIYGVYAEPLPWFAMRYVAGGSLQDALDAGGARLKSAEFLESLATQILAALSKAHAAGVIHRDIKPANILMDETSDRVWLTDFGIARASVDAGLTHSFAIAGTPRYMSPEQAAGETVDRRSDLFSLGSVLYHCATGRPPFAGSHDTAIADSVRLAKTEPITGENRDLPKWIVGLIGNLMGRDAADRPSSADDVLALIAEKTYTRPPLRIPRRVFVVGAGVAGAAMLWRYFPRLRATGSVRNLRSGERFTGLHAAVDAAQSGDRLALSGSFTVTRPITTTYPLDLFFEAEEGEVPEINFRHAGQWGIKVMGNAGAKGIRFSSEGHPYSYAMFSAESAASLTVEDCHFESLQPDVFDWAILGGAIEHTTVTNCSFSGARLTAVNVDNAYILGTAGTTRLSISGCKMSVVNGFRIRGRIPGAVFEFDVEDNDISCSSLFEFSGKNEVHPTHIRLRRNTIDAAFALCLTHRTTSGLGRFYKYVTWESEGNTFVGDAMFLRCRKPVIEIATYEEYLDLKSARGQD